MNFLFQGILIIVSSTAPITISGIPEAVGIYDMPHNQIYVIPEVKDNEFVLWHELGHYLYHKNFFGVGAKDHINFWIEVNKKMKYCKEGTPAWEIQADYYAWSHLSWNRQKMPPEVEAYFKYYK